MDSTKKARYRLGKLSNRRTGWPLATLGFYGPDLSTASKAVLCLVRADGAEAEILKKWHTTADARSDATVLTEVLGLLDANGVQRVATTQRIIGCPHESAEYEGEEYCPRPECAFWVRRDRWTGEPVQPSAERARALARLAQKLNGEE